VERGGRVAPDGPLRRRGAAGEPDQPPRQGRSAVLPRRRKRERDPDPLRLRVLRQQGRAATGQPLRDDNRGR